MESYNNEYYKQRELAKLKSCRSFDNKFYCAECKKFIKDCDAKLYYYDHLVNPYLPNVVCDDCINKFREKEKRRIIEEENFREKMKQFECKHCKKIVHTTTFSPTNRKLCADCQIAKYQKKLIDFIKFAKQEPKECKDCKNILQLDGSCRYCTIIDFAKEKCLKLKNNIVTDEAHKLFQEINKESQLLESNDSNNKIIKERFEQLKNADKFLEETDKDFEYVRINDYNGCLCKKCGEIFDEHYRRINICSVSRKSNREEHMNYMCKLILAGIIMH